MAVEISMVQAVLFGIVQGLTEFLPISSSAHLRILPELIGMEDPGSAFTAVIQLGTMAAVLIYFAKDIGKAFMGWANSLTGKGGNTSEARMGWAVFVGSLPIIVAAVLLKDIIKSDSVRSLYVVSAMMIGFGLVMLAAEKLGSKKRELDSVKPKDGVIVGLWQVLALIPGVSRSGSTISGGYFDGFDRAAAARFSFLLSVPSVTAAGLYELFDERKNLGGVNMMPTIVATIVSFAVGYAAIAWLIKYLQKRGVMVFVIYRVALGFILLALLQTGKLHATTQAPPVTKAPVDSVQPQAVLQTAPAMDGKMTPEHSKAWTDAVKPPDPTTLTATEPDPVKTAKETAPTEGQD